MEGALKRDSEGERVRGTKRKKGREKRRQVHNFLKYVNEVKG